ncbi:hypothetical protein L510_4883, partial [Bordetella bronchiseptica MBORD591]
EAAGPATDAAALAPWLAPAEQAQWRERLADASAAGHVA